MDAAVWHGPLPSTYVFIYCKQMTNQSRVCLCANPLALCTFSLPFFILLSVHLHCLWKASRLSTRPGKPAITSSFIKSLEFFLGKPPVKPLAVCSAGVGERNHGSTDVALDGGLHVAFHRVLPGRGDILQPPYVQPLPCAQSPCQHGQSASSRSSCGGKASGVPADQLKSHLLWDHVRCWQLWDSHPCVQVHSKRPR